jgi:hypothetical protein
METLNLSIADVVESMMAFALLSDGFFSSPYTVDYIEPGGESEKRSSTS